MGRAWHMASAVPGLADPRALHQPRVKRSVCVGVLDADALLCVRWQAKHGRARSTAAELRSHFGRREIHVSAVTTAVLSSTNRCVAGLAPTLPLLRKRAAAVTLAHTHTLSLSPSPSLSRTTHTRIPIQGSFHLAPTPRQWVVHVPRACSRWFHSSSQVTANSLSFLDIDDDHTQGTHPTIVPPLPLRRRISAACGVVGVAVHPEWRWNDHCPWRSMNKA